MARARFVVRGRVQAVGFRWFVWREAERLKVRGYVRNLPDGAVEVVAEGSEETLAQLERVLSRGPATARVDRVERSDIPHETGMSNAFDIR